MSSSSKEKLQAINKIEKLLLRLLGIDIDHSTNEMCCERINIEYRWLRRCALYVLEKFPIAPTESSELDTWISSVKNNFKILPLPENKNISWQSPGKIFRKPKK
jgi:hypothetical protein